MDDSGTPKIRILLADPDAAFCVFVRYSLEQLGFAVTIASDGADLVARFGSELFDVVLVGLTTPFLDGLQVLHAIKQRSPTTPVILLCEAEHSPRAEAGMQEGAFTYFRKPLNNFAPLGDAIRRAHETQMLQRQSAEPHVISPPDRASESDTPVLSFLRQLTEATRTQPLNVTLQTLSTAGARLMQTPYGIVLHTQAGQGFQVLSAHGFDNLETATRDLAAHIGDQFIARVMTERRTIITPTLAEQVESVSQQAVGIPLLAADQAFGALVVYPLARTAINAARLAQLETLASQGDIAIELARLRDENMRLTPIDPTTGVLKREPFLELADREFRRSWRYNQPVTVIIVDVDNLSEINLNYGRRLGDQVLHAVANVCTNVIRSIDLIGRYDGDALALLLLMTENADAKGVAERLRTEINAIQLANAPSPIQITATLGVCSYPRSGCTSIFDLLAVSQEAQRAARYRGANQITYG